MKKVLEEDQKNKRILTKRIVVAFSENGEGTMNCQGLGVFQCLGCPDLKYTRDLTVQGVVGQDKFPEKYSQEYNVMMKWAILIIGQRGIYIHEGPATISENGGASAGCIHLEEGNAKKVYDWISERTRITIDYPW